MKLSLYTAVLAAVATTAAAKRCEFPLRYCASSLRALGYPEDHMQEAIANEGCAHDLNPDHYLFRCKDDGRLAFDFTGYYPQGGCLDRGLGKYAKDHFPTIGTIINERTCPKAGETQDKPCAEEVAKPPSRMLRGQEHVLKEGHRGM